VTNLKNTIFDFKRFIGRKYDDPASQNLAANKPYAVVPTSTGGTGVEVSYLGKSTVFSIEQITAMLLTKLKETTETALQTKVSDCVISVSHNS
jgi:molecular chaperone DnaK (HSP70)